MLVEIFLKFLICIVYIELLKVIHLRGETIQQVSLEPSLLHKEAKQPLWRTVWRFLKKTKNRATI